MVYLSGLWAFWGQYNCILISCIRVCPLLLYPSVPFNFDCKYLLAALPLRQVLTVVAQI